MDSFFTQAMRTAGNMMDQAFSQSLSYAAGNTVTSFNGRVTPVITVPEGDAAGQRITKKMNVRCNPEAMAFNPNGIILYQGERWTIDQVSDENGITVLELSMERDVVRGGSFKGSFR